MGRRQHYWRCRELGVGEVDAITSHCQETQLALGCHLVHGIHLEAPYGIEVLIMDRIPSIKP